MGKLLSAVAIVVTLAGCGTQSDPRLIVTQRLRDACADFGVNDEQIIGIIQAAESDRLAGWEYNDEVVLGEQTCSDRADQWGDQVECGHCFAAVINQVYGL